MAPSLVRVGAAALAYASGAVALQAYQLQESYTPSNFFDTFNFFSGADPNKGFVKYRTKADATTLGLIKKNTDDVSIAVDSTSYDQDGRSSVRLESANTYNGGLFIADFSHFPKTACGAWPAFWMYGPNWPNGGELDIYEGFHLDTKNSIGAHTDSPNAVGSCKIQSSDMSGSSLTTSDCYVYASGQTSNAGCAVQETNGLFGNENGGICEYPLRLDRGADRR
jgi:hypothetical protein